MHTKLLISAALIGGVALSSCRLGAPDTPRNSVSIPNVKLSTPTEYTCHFTDPSTFNSGAAQTTEIYVFDKFQRVLNDDREREPDPDAPVAAEQLGPETEDIANMKKAIVVFHGGAWSTGSAKTATNPYNGGFLVSPTHSQPLGTLRGEGYLIISAQYRLTNGVDDPSTLVDETLISTPASHQFPAQLIDAKAAINCAKNILANVKDANGDMKYPANMPVISAGASAGATLAMLVASESTATNTTLDDEPQINTAVTVDNITTFSGGVASGTKTTVAAAVALDPAINLVDLHADEDDGFDDTVSPTVDTGDGINGKEIVDHWLCGSTGCLDDTMITTSTQKTEKLADADPLTYATAGQDTLIYLACGDTSNTYTLNSQGAGNTTLGAGFDNCKGGNEYYDETDYIHTPATTTAPAVYASNTWLQPTNTEHYIMEGPRCLKADANSGTSDPDLNVCEEVGINWVALVDFLAYNAP